MTKIPRKWQKRFNQFLKEKFGQVAGIDHFGNYVIIRRGG